MGVTSVHKVYCLQTMHSLHSTCKLNESKRDFYFYTFVTDEWKLEEDESDVISTIENFELFKSVFPDVVEEFESIEASKKENKKGELCHHCRQRKVFC